jgi:hypothetical protein
MNIADFVGFEDLPALTVSVFWDIMLSIQVKVI